MVNNTPTTIKELKMLIDLRLPYPMTLPAIKLPKAIPTIDKALTIVL
jgi:hypothetical protein